jgi:HNH endonuclease
MASGERYYLLELTHRPAVYGDLGNILKIEGLVIGGEGAQAVLLLPDAERFIVLPRTMDGSKIPVRNLTNEEWVDFLKRTDDPEVLVMPEKAFHRKLRYQISGHVQQKVWAADGFKCVFCGQPMGKMQLTIDHWNPLELGGANDTGNYLSVCRKENKDKGSMSPQDWCKLKGYDYNFYVEYLKNRIIP